MAKPPTKAQVKNRSIKELTGIIASKDQALEEKGLVIIGKDELLDEQAERIAAMVEELEEMRLAPPLEEVAVKAVPEVEINPEGPDDIAELEQAVEVLKGAGFQVLTDARLMDGRGEDGRRGRSFRYRGRYEVAIVRGRRRI